MKVSHLYIFIVVILIIGLKYTSYPQQLFTSTSSTQGDNVKRLLASLKDRTEHLEEGLTNAHPESAFSLFAFQHTSTDDIQGTIYSLQNPHVCDTKRYLLFNDASIQKASNPFEYIEMVNDALLEALAYDELLVMLHVSLPSSPQDLLGRRLLQEASSAAINASEILARQERAEQRVAAMDQKLQLTPQRQVRAGTPPLIITFGTSAPFVRDSWLPFQHLAAPQEPVREEWLHPHDGWRWSNRPRCARGMHCYFREFSCCDAPFNRSIDSGAWSFRIYRTNQTLDVELLEKQLGMKKHPLAWWKAQCVRYTMRPTKFLEGYIRSIVPVALLAQEARSHAVLLLDTDDSYQIRRNLAAAKIALHTALKQLPLDVPVLLSVQDDVALQLCKEVVSSLHLVLAPYVAPVSHGDMRFVAGGYDVLGPEREMFSFIAQMHIYSPLARYLICNLERSAQCRIAAALTLASDSTASVPSLISLSF